MSAPTVALAPAPVPARIPAVRPKAARLSRLQIDEIVGEFGVDAYSLASRPKGGAQ